MPYIEGFLTPVPGHRRDDYVAHANAAFAILRDVGVTRLVEAWGEDVPRGTVNDLWGAVDAQAGEAVVFSWFEYPDRATRDAASERMRTDPRMEALGAGMPFDMRRMIWGGFRVVSDAGVTTETAGFVDGVVLPLSRDADAAYRDHAAALAPVFLDHGARRVVDTAADDVPAGETTDFHRAVLTQAGEAPAFGWIEWPSRAARDQGWGAVMADARMTGAAPPPYDGKRMAFGGFSVLLDLRA
ncbi:DUF1428 domain-containing protein [Sphingomonas adhaesiva]|uniref:DUF1428 domain-containing protein n=1 Tax=Sphingomonas adhaesiva TaxID=28212 RepID=A0A2A4I6Y2_9SPHN|nr:DUF1428 domain-containing protein [Sphingomonas adhaesiva]PCG13532.1 DUF1428 domain-containing protein [Sphingomonas adhaesiva]